jgi:RNA polymerase sigma factor (sigma-70 family)
VTQQCGEHRVSTADVSAVFHEHGGALERLAARITGDREDARDVVADAFAALLERGPSDPGHAVPWLYLTVRHRAYNRLRTRRRARRRLTKLATETTTPFGPESVLRHDERVRALLTAAAGQLSDRDRAAVLLRHLDHAPYEDVASVLGTTPAQARVVVHRATARLRRQVVATLSRRHKVQSSCIDNGAHDGCTGCVALSDEVIALLQGAVVLPLSRPRRVASAMREWWRRTGSTANRAAVYVGDVLGPVAALVAIAAAPAAAVPAPATATHQLASASATGPAPRPAQDIAATAPSNRPVEPRVPSAMPVVVPRPTAVTIGAPLVGDDPGTSPGLSQTIHQQRRSVLDVLGLPIGLPDPLDSPQGPDVDIRSLEIATLAGPDGRAAALRWRIGFMAPPPANVGVGLSWGFEHTDCYASFSWPRGDAVGVNCPDHAVAGVNLLYRPVGYGKAEVHLHGDLLEVTLPFSALDDGANSLFRPGARLVSMVASASCYVNYLERSGCENGDRAPDDWNGYTYRIEE